MNRQPWTQAANPSAPEGEVAYRFRPDARFAYRATRPGPQHPWTVQAGGGDPYAGQGVRYLYN